MNSIDRFCVAMTVCFLSRATPTEFCVFAHLNLAHSVLSSSVLSWPNHPHSMMLPPHFIPLISTLQSIFLLCFACKEHPHYDAPSSYFSVPRQYAAGGRMFLLSYFFFCLVFKHFVSVGKKTTFDAFKFALHVELWGHQL